MAKIPINMQSGEIEKKEIIIGIDLGTTNSLVAYIDNGIPAIVKDNNSQNTLVPSVILFGEEDQIVVGDLAKSQIILRPERTIYSVKRLMGKSYNDVENYEKLLSYDIIDQENELVKVKVGNRFYNPIELSSEILKYLKTRIEKHLGESVSKAVITVPAYFNDSQRQATRDAGKLAGLDVLRILNEPTAASLAYGFGTKEDKKETIAVYDLGGGTFDISILKLDHGVFDVLSTDGDTFLGGDDVDRAIIDHWIKEKGIDLSRLEEDKSLGQALRLRAEQAKKALSAQNEYRSDDGEYALSHEIFHALVQPIIQRTIDKCQSALNEAELKTEDIDKIILVGGSTRMPLVKKTVSDFFGQKAYDDINPDEVVAIGAAVQADILSGNTTGYLLLDVTPLSLGIETMGGLMDTIIPRNSKVPASVGRSYTTSVDGQKNLKVSVYQGERELVENNRKLGEFILKDIPPMPAGIPKIEVRFILDADGILRVRAKEERSGKETEVVIKSQYGISEEEMGKMLLDSLKHADADMKKKALLESINEAQSILRAGEKFVIQNKEILSEEEIEKLNQHILSLSSAIESKDRNQIESEMKSLNDYSTPLAERAMDHNIKKALSGKKLA